MSNALVRSGGSYTNFAQQGSFDWVALSGSTVAFSVEVLSRFAKAGVEVITVAIGQAIFSNFKLRPDGQQRFSDAIANLKAFSSYGQVLWFGFGVKHIVKILSETEQGTACAAMCACLSVSYDSHFSSRVLKALTDLQATPDTLTPSLFQWNALLNVCAGAVNNSVFAKQVEGMSRLLSLPITSQSILLNVPTSPEALAKALLEVGQVSRGDVRSVTLLGGVDCGWLAAVSQWLLSLSVDVADESGSLIYSHRNPYCPSYPQVVIVRNLDASRNTFATTLRQRSFFIPPGKLCFDILPGLGDPAHQYFSMGRSEWSSILHDSFGDSIDVLISSKNAAAFAHFLYCGFSFINDRNCVDCLNLRGGLSATARERQILHMSFASKRLPELATIFTIGESMARDAAFGIFKSGEFPDDLRKICPCRKCRLNYKGVTSARFLWRNRGDVVCLEALAATVFEYIWILSWLEIDEAVRPSATGLCRLYYRLLQQPIIMRTPYVIRSQFFNLALSDVIQLFTGLDDARESSTSSVSACCAGGICVYLSSLKNPTTAPQDQLRVMVVLGQIERRGSIYEMVVDKKPPKGLESLNNISDFLQAYGPNLGLRLIVDETLASKVLEACLFISSHPYEQQMGEFFPGHRYLNHTTPRLAEEFRMFGPAKIRKKLASRLFSSPCLSLIPSIYALSVHENSYVSWTGPCISAKETLWTDTSNNIDLCPSSTEWILVSEHGDGLHFWQEVLRGSYTIFYAIICHPLAGLNFRLTSTSCLLCTLVELHPRPPPPPTPEWALKPDLGDVVMFFTKEPGLSMVELIKAPPELYARPGRTFP